SPEIHDRVIAAIQALAADPRPTGPGNFTGAN
ncbi:MAG: hypothetical protein JWM99_1287, partial [Verrucomicrobiales bacterium]|nr:hypothetical protein [Verrucomicrobiales bacterium]